MRSGTATELVRLVEHPPLYTAGTSAKSEELTDPTRFPTFNAGRAALWGLMMRDLTVLRKSMREFIPRTVIQPFLLCFAFLYVFPNIGQGIGGGGGAAG